ncbi:hypothetical protein [Streptomyces sp. WMMB 322]|uniref:hypothetical protein n=1 Tax=Streptomyces sp. WMMB 322 TaxID=1286821 RepID=UPI0006E19FF1|nr:hypothetical protein [Streptomyces sp. WMMB 322]SCK55931.1 hypothetical protein H180DRAFT_05170 [Streptomyces sp. WMMB 322]
MHETDRGLPRAATGARRLPPALTTDIPVLVMLVACWMLVPVAWAHLATGFALVALILLHLWTRRGLVAGLFRGDRRTRRGRWGRRLAYGLFLLAAILMTASGVMRWAGMPPEHTAHAATSTMLLAGALVHIWASRRALRARLRRAGPATAGARATATGRRDSATTR